MERSDGEGSCLAETPEGVKLRLRVTPNASKTEVKGLMQGNLRLKIQAPPVEGKANAAVKKWAAGAFGLRPAQVEIMSGDRGRDKILLLRECSLSDARDRLGLLLGETPA